MSVDSLEETEEHHFKIGFAGHPIDSAPTLIKPTIETEISSNEKFCMMALGSGGYCDNHEDESLFAASHPEMEIFPEDNSINQHQLKLDACETFVEDLSCQESSVFESEKKMWHEQQYSDCAAASSSISPDGSSSESATPKDLFPKRILFVSRALLMQSPREIARTLQVVAYAATEGRVATVFDCAKDGFEALMLLSRNNYHAMFVYEDLPNMTGRTMIRIAGEMSAGRMCPVVLIGVNEPLTPQESVHITRVVRDDVNKPFLGVDFVECLRLVL